MIKLKEAMTSSDENLLNRVINYKNQNYKIAVANNPNISESLMNKLVDLDIEKVDSALASNESISPNIARKIYTRGAYCSLINLSKNTNCPVDVLDKLGNDVRFYINLCENPSTLLKTIKRIFNNSGEVDFCFDVITGSVSKRNDISEILIKYKVV